MAAGGIFALADNQVGSPPFILSIGVSGDLISATEGPHVVRAGSDIFITIITTNISKRGMHCSKVVDSATNLDPGYEYDIRDSSGNPVKKNVRNGPEIGSFRNLGCILKAGQSMASSSLLTTAFDLSKPGEYTIQVSRRISENADVDEGFVKSNTITLMVTDDDAVIDKATPRFALSIAAYSNGRFSETNIPFIVKAGEDVGVNITKTVTSKHEVDCSIAWSNLSGLDEKYQYDVRDSSGNPVGKHTTTQPLPYMSGLSSGVCKPGEAPGNSGNNTITRLYDLSRPGKYTIQVSQPTSNNPADGAVKSNTITVTVTQ